MAELPELTPLRQVWPTQPDEQAGKRKPKPNDATKRRPAEPRERPRHDDDANGRIDDYA